jgi:hypothetical protein
MQPYGPPSGPGQPPGPQSSLTPDELAAVVRRATELDTPRPVHGPDLDVEDARLVLQEAGVSPAAAQQALEEWRRGEIAAAPPPPLPDPGGRLSPVVVIERLVPLDPAAVKTTLDAVLRRQWFTRGRQFGAAGAEWVPKSGLIADMRRRLDVRGTLLLDEVSRLRLEVAPSKPGTASIRLTADLGGLRSRLLSAMVGLPAAAGATVSLVGIPTTTPELIASGLPIGLALAGGGYVGAGRTMERRRAKIEEALHIIVDRLAGPG